MHHVINQKMFKEKIIILCKWNPEQVQNRKSISAFSGQHRWLWVALLHAYLKAPGSKVMDIFYFFAGIDFNI